MVDLSLRRFCSIAKWNCTMKLHSSFTEHSNRNLEGTLLPSLEISLSELTLEGREVYWWIHNPWQTIYFDFFNTKTSLDEKQEIFLNLIAGESQRVETIRRLKFWTIRAVWLKGCQTQPVMLCMWWCWDRDGQNFWRREPTSW